VANAFLTWTPDSRYIYFDTGFTTDPAIFRIEILDPEGAASDRVEGFSWSGWELSVFGPDYRQTARSLLSVTQHARRSTPSICSSGKFVLKNAQRA